MALYFFAAITGALFFALFYVAIRAGESTVGRWDSATYGADDTAAEYGPELSALDVMDGFPDKFRR